MTLFENAKKLLKEISDLVKSYNKSDTKLRAAYAFSYKHHRLKKNVILYEAFFGRGMVCGPYALFLEALEDPRLSNCKHVWVIDNEEDLESYKSEYSGRKNVSFVKTNTKKYMKALATAGRIVNNMAFMNIYTKREGQVYINTWHGVPFRKFGYDIPNAPRENTNIMRNFLSTDYLVSANTFMTEKFRNSYKLDGIFEGKVLEETYPRLDTLFRFSKEQVFAKFRDYGVCPDNSKKIILYAPAWRGEYYSHASSDVDFCGTFKSELEKHIDTDRYQVFVSLHQRVYQLARTKLNGSWFIPATIDANEILSVTDILVTDFSSIFYDFLATGRPVLFYSEDSEAFRNGKMLYQTEEHLPGPCTSTIEELARLINDIETVTGEWKSKYEEIRRFANSYSDGNASKRVIDAAFFGNEENCNVKNFKNNKKKLLISRGKMKLNGITTTFVNLLKEIDYDNYDVSVMIARSDIDREIHTFDLINPKARILYRNTTLDLTFFENLKHRLNLNFGTSTPYQDIYKKEWKRSFGDAKFDAVIDFEGYSLFHQLLLLQAENAKHLIWLHSDMKNECLTKYDWLVNVFRMYKFFDKVVACGKSIERVSAEKLGKYIAKDKLTYSRNIIDFEKIIRLSDDSNIVTVDGKKMFVSKEADTVVKWENKELVNEIYEAEYIPFTPEFNEKGERNYRFAALGRPSPEKNHENLIKAFAKLHKAYPNTFLYILGMGPLYDDLKALTEKLGVGEYVFLPGHVNNPYIIMKHCDCFVFPSYYEAYPVVTFEARTLGMPIVMSRFDTVDEVSMENGQELIGHEEKDILAGMTDFINGKVPSDYKFDYEDYNRECMSEFYKVIGEETV